MNSIKTIKALNKKELEAGVTSSGSWHRDFADTAFIYIGGLPFDLSEGDIVTIFSQFGEPVFVNLVRDKETGKSKGFAFLKYEDQRSCDLAVDNLGGASVMGRMLRVDHTRYKRKDDEVLVDNTRDGGAEGEGDAAGVQVGKRRAESVEEEERPTLKEEMELAVLLREHDEDDPMKEYLVQQKKEEVAAAVEEYEREKRRRKRSERSHRDREHRAHRSKENRADEEKRIESTRDRESHRYHRRASDNELEDEDRHRHREHRYHHRRSKSPPIAHERHQRDQQDRRRRSSTPMAAEPTSERRRRTYKQG